jgi:crotonobetainyl-CoA:carnitine CoA-transferase CaiB-like acyl-CoA transferase
VLDLKHEKGRAAFHRMLPRYDVLFEQFRPGVLARLGLGHDELRRKHPRLVVCALTGYGQDGPLAQRAGHDLNYLARAGVLGLQGPASGPPQVPGFQLADVAGGLWSVVAILAALRERDRTGEGAVLDVAMAECVQLFAPTGFGALFGGEVPKRGDEVLSGGIAAYQTYLSKDDQPITFAALEPKFWTSFCAGVGIEPDMTVLFPGPHQVAWKEKLAAIFRARTRAEWEAFQAERDCCLEPVLRPEELRADPHLVARGVFFDIETPAGPIPQIRTPVTPRGAATTPPPGPGEHTDAILADAGFGPDEIAELRAAGAVR